MFVAGYDDGLQVINLMDPTNPYTSATTTPMMAPDEHGARPLHRDTTGLLGIDVRNADGLIVVSD